MNARKKRTPATGRSAPITRKPRNRGRPRSTQGGVGRDTIVTAARKLLEKLPPHKATISSIAREAGVDPALVRYYFSSRDHLLLAVVEEILEGWHASHPSPAAGPASRLATHVSDMLDFSLQVRSMQRLMIDECAASKSPEIRRRVRDLNVGAVNFYALLVHSDKSAKKNPLDPLFMYVAVIGLCELFAASQSMITPLAPEGVTAEEMAKRYKEFIVRLVLDGLRKDVEPWSMRPDGGR